METYLLNRLQTGKFAFLLLEKFENISEKDL